MTDKEAFNVFAKGAGFVIVVLAVFTLITVGMSATVGTPEEALSEKFKVVDTYEKCNVVRYTDETQRWHYFLDCR